MNTGFLLYLGAGLATGSLSLGLVIGIVYSVKPEYRGFRYGAFIIPFSIVYGAGSYLALIAFGFEFLGLDLGVFLALLSGGALAGLLTAAFKLRFKSKSMLLVQSIPFVINYPFLPIAIWNLVYATWIVKKEAWDNGLQSGRSKSEMSNPSG